SNGVLTCRQALDGAERWRTRLAFTPCWVGLERDLVLLGGEGRIACLHRDSGKPLWDLPLEQGMRLSAFRLSSGRLFCLINERRLLAIDAERGWPLWDRWAPGGPWLGLRGRYFPAYAAAGNRVLVQTAAAKAWLLDAANGKLIMEMPAPEL